MRSTEQASPAQAPTAQTGQHCVICAAAVPDNRLMCVEHWSLLPVGHQVAVRRTWRAWRKSTFELHRAQKLEAYRSARRAAVAYVREALDARQAQQVAP